MLWSTCYVLLFRPSPRPFHGWRRLILRLFGAQMGRKANVYPSAKVWAPWNLIMHDGACLADDVDCYNVGIVTIGENTTVSQYSYLCTASHDYTLKSHPLIHSPITIEAQVWVCADCFVGPGVTIGEGSVVGARSSVFKSIESWGVYAGSPAQCIKKREFKNDQS